MTGKKKNNPRLQSKASPFPDHKQIREQAERETNGISLADLDNMTREEIRQMIYEMQVKQVEARLENAQLHSSLEHANDILKGISVGVWSLTWPDLEIVYLSPATEEIYKRPLQDFYENPDLWQEVTHPEDQDITKSAFEQLRETGAAKRQCRILRPDGSIAWVSDKSKLVFDENNNPIRVEGICRDITERKQADDALTESEKLFQILIENMAEGVVIKNDSDQYLHWNQKASEIFGINIDDLKGQTTESFWPQIIHEDGCVYNKNEFPSLHTLYTGEPCENVVMGIRMGHQNITWIKANTRPYFKPGDIKPSAVIISFSDISDQKQAEEALRQSENYYRTIFETSASAIFIIEEDTTISHVNSNFEKLSGYSKQEVEGKKSWTEFIQPDDLSWMRENHYLRGRDPRAAPLNYEFRFFVRNGELRYGYLTIDMIPDTTQSVASLIDITERKQAEKNLRESELRFQRMLSLVPDMISIHDTDLNIVYSNWNGFGAVPEERQILKTKCYKTYRGYDDTCPDCQAKTVLESRKPFQTEKQLPDGRWVDLRVIPLLDEMGDVELFMEWVRDITERKQAEAALKESERDKALILNSTAELIAYYDTDLRIIWTNRAAANSVNMQPEDLLNLYCYEIWQQRTEPCPGCPVLAAKEAREPQQAERKMYDGRFWSIRGYPIFNDEGDVIALVEISQEITEQKHAEEMSAKLQEQFHQAQKLESIGRLAGGVAHDLNNLLSPILGYGEMLLEDAPANDPRTESIEEIVSAGKRAQSLIRQLLAFSRKQPLQFQSLDINELLKGFKKLLRRTLRENIEIQIHFGEAIPQVVGDVGQIEQVIMNLVVNAQDAMPDGGILTIETAKLDLDENYAKQKNGVTAGPYVMLAISDNGIGMDEDTFNHLFEPFFTTKEQGKGTGLGMSTAYGIIKQHGGNIWAYSEPGQGTTIKIYLPVSTKPSDVIPRADHRKPVSKGMETVLLAEDDQQVRNLTTAILERYGYKVLVAGSGQETLSILTNHEGPIHLLITDVIMPDMNGKELYNKILKAYPEIRVLYMSGYTDNVIAHHGVIDPGVNFIEKPFNVKALAAKVRQVLEE